MTNFRETFIARDKSTISKNETKLNPWEKEFFENVRDLNPKSFSLKQFNRLQEIAAKFK